MELVMQSSRVLQARLAGDSVRCLSGSMVAYEGDVTFTREGAMSGGLGGALKRKMSGESLSLMTAKGNGVVYLASEATEIELIRLSGETLTVESSSLLALEPSLKTDVVFAGVQGARAGQGLFTTTVTGTGTCALLSDGPMIALEVAPQYPLVVDPDAFIARRGALQQSFVTGVSWRMLVGQDAGEAFSLRFDGNGVVYIQPAER